MIESGAIMLAALTDAGEPPTELRMFAFGENATSKGTFVLDKRGAESVMAAFAQHGVDRLPIDVAHGMLASGGSHEQHLAVGWFVPDVRDDGLWAASIEWTERGAEMVRAREMRFISPAFLADKKGRIIEMINLAVTNLPATRGAQPIATSQQGAEDMSDQTIRIALGLADDADVGEAVQALANDRAVLLAALEASTVEAAVGNYRAAQARVEELEQERAKAALTAKLDAAGLPPSQRAFAETLSGAQLDQFIALAATATATLKAPVKQRAEAACSEEQIDRAITIARARGVTLSRDDAAREIAKIQAAYRAEAGAR